MKLPRAPNFLTSLVLRFESVLLCFLVAACCGFVFPFSFFSPNPAHFCNEQFPQGGESSGQPDFHVFCGRLGREHNTIWKTKVQYVPVENCHFFLFFNTRYILIWNKFLFSSLCSYYMHWVSLLETSIHFYDHYVFACFFCLTEMFTNCIIMNSEKI